MEQGTKRKPTYKQMAFETAVRNPERYIGLLTALRSFEGQILNDENLLKIISHLYLVGEVSSNDIVITDKTKINDIKEKVIEVDNTRRADGGFPMGYQSRFWTYMRTPSELGFVFAQYEKEFKFSDIAKKFIDGKIDEQEAFSIQAIKYSRKSPYRNVSNDFNFFSFILKVLLKLKDKNKSLSYEQFIVAMFSTNGNVDEFLSVITKNKFKDYETVYNFAKTHFGATTKIKTITQDYPDVVRRLFIISGFISIRYSGKKLIQINENKLEYIQDLLKIDFLLSDEEKTNPQNYFDKLNTKTDEFLSIAQKYRESDKINGEIYVNKIFDIIKNYKIDENIIVESIEKIGTRETVIDEFKEIPEPLKLEFYISILIALKYGNEFSIRPNYKADHIGKPYSHAPGNMGDIEIYSPKIYWLIEVTLIRNKIQQLNHETTSVIRHLYSNEKFKNHFIKYLSFIAPVIHEDTKEFYDISVVKGQKEGYKISMKPYSINGFVESTLKKENFSDMEEYTENVKSDFRSRLSL
jgi:hypothetical protein